MHRVMNEAPRNRDGVTSPPANSGDVPRPIRLLMVSLSFDPTFRHGGPSVTDAALAGGLAKLPEILVSVLTINTGVSPERTAFSPGSKRFGDSDDIELRYCRARKGRHWSWELARALPGSIAAADCVHLVGTFSWTVPVTMLLAAVLRKPVIWMPHGAVQEVMISQSRPGLKKIWLWVLRRIARRVTVRAIAPSDIEIDAFRRLMPLVPIEKIPHGVDVPASVPARQPSASGALRLIVLARLVPQKGIDQLLRAMSKTSASARLDVYGDGPGLGRLRAMARDLGLEDRVEFHGFAPPERQGEIFARSDLLVLPSVWESFGMVVLEALAHGVPVLASKQSAWSALEEVDCGFWRDATPDGLARAIDEAAERDLVAMGVRGRDWVIGAFNWDRAARLEADLALRLVGHAS
jgi:glycosyltransferase involved in cell wall biosynthesis